MFDQVIAKYEEKQSEILASSQDALDRADAEKRELTQDEKSLVDANNAEFDRIASEMDTRKRVNAQAARMQQPRERKTEPGVGSAPSDDEGGDGVQTRHLNTPASRAVARGGKWGWNTLGEFAQRVRAAHPSFGGEVDQRLQAALTTYSQEGVGSDGGFAVPPDFRATIMNIVTGEDTLWSRADASPTNSNSVTVPVDETTPWGTSGVRVYTRAEAAAMTQSKIALKEVTVRLNEVYALVPVTDELLEDAPLLANHLTKKAGEAFDFKINDYIINGTGAGQPLGIMNAPATVDCAAVGSQTAATIHADNIIAMWGRVPGRVRAQTIWICNQDVEVALMKLGMPVVPAASTTPVGGMPVYMPPAGLSAVPYGTLLGRPVIVTEACAALGTTGDIILAYMPGYFLPFKTGGVKADVSMHLWFDQGTTAFRWTLRFGGQPWLSAPIARKTSSATLSHFITLATRSG